jgi:hypothetical protein
MTVSVSVEIEGIIQQFPAVLKLCANPLCTKSPSGGPRYFLPTVPWHKFCDDPCKDQWNNKQK